MGIKSMTVECASCDYTVEIPANRMGIYKDGEVIIISYDCPECGIQRMKFGGDSD